MGSDEKHPRYPSLGQGGKYQDKDTPKVEYLGTRESGTASFGLSSNNGITDTDGKD